MCSKREREREKRVVISFFSRPDTGCVVKGQDHAGGILFFFFIIIPHLSGQYLKWHGCVIGEGPITVVEARRGCRSVDQSNIEVWLRIGGDIEEGGARSGSVSRLISRCHSATVGC